MSHKCRRLAGEKVQKMKRPDVIQKLAKRIYRYRRTNNIKGNAETDWELAERYWGCGANRMLHSPFYFKMWIRNQVR